MKVYLVFRTTTEHHSNDLCWDDGYYDDYYEDVTVSDHLVGVSACYSSRSEEEAAFLSWNQHNGIPYA